MRKVPIVLVGNKADMVADRKVATSEGLNLAKLFSCSFFETSAENRLNVEECFFQLVREIRKSMGWKKPQNKRKGIQKVKQCILL